MMRFKIHFKWPGSEDEDSIIVEGDTIVDVQDKASAEMLSRDVDTETCWSESA